MQTSDSKVSQGNLDNQTALQFKCNECNQSFRSETELRDHQSTYQRTRAAIGGSSSLLKKALIHNFVVSVRYWRLGCVTKPV
jgi:hypothetical protein